MVSSGECSSQSPGFCGAGTLIASSREISMRMASAVIAAFGPGADEIAMVMETTSSTAVITNDCHMKIVSVKGITPVIASRLLGTLAGLACSCAADEDRPIAQVAPSPRYAAAPAAR